MSWRPNVVRSLGWDPGHHEEVRNGPENKIHIRKVIFRVSEKFRNFSVLYRRVSRRFRRVTSGPTFSGGLHRPSRAQPASPSRATLKRKRKTLGEITVHGGTVHTVTVHDGTVHAVTVHVGLFPPPTSFLLYIKRGGAGVPVIPFLQP